jgi:hypothetical protein
MARLLLGWGGTNKWKNRFEGRTLSRTVTYLVASNGKEKDCLAW